jgi:hypothetical protein
LLEADNDKVVQDLEFIAQFYEGMGHEARVEALLENSEAEGLDGPADQELTKKKRGLDRIIRG